MHVNAQCEAFVMTMNMHQHKTKVSYLPGNKALNSLRNDVNFGVHVNETHAKEYRGKKKAFGEASNDSHHI